MKSVIRVLILCSYLSNAYAQVPSYVPSSGLVGWWPFSGNANDESGNGNNGTVNGATLTADRFSVSNKAYSFDGINDYVSIANNVIFNVSSYSISLWVKKTGSGTAGKQHWSILMKNTSGNRYDDPFHISHTNTVVSSEFAPYPNQLFTDIGGGSSIATNTIYPGFTLSSLQWDHVTVTFDNSNNLYNVYINGQLFNSITVNYNPNSNTAPITIGYWPGYANFFKGDIDDIGIWNRALTSCEVGRLYESSLLTVSAGTDQQVCSGTSVTLAGSGATTYTWDNGITDNTPFTTSATTTYTVTGTDTYGCTATDQVNVVVTPVPSVSASDSTICNGSTVTLTASTTAPINETPCTSSELPLTLQSGLVGYWPFCGNANDESGNGNNGTVNGATLTTDRFGNTNSAYDFDGNDWIDVISSDQNNLPNTLSMGCWIKTTITHLNSGVIGKWNDSDGAMTLGKEQYVLQAANNQGGMHFWTKTSSQISAKESGNEYKNGLWHFYIGTWDGATMKLYRDGSLVQSSSQTGIITNFIQNFEIGRYSGGMIPDNYFTGTIDDVSLWNRALTPSEIQELYNIGNPTYAWSNGATTASTAVSPTSTTTYTCDVTLNGITCSDDVTVTVLQPTSATISPTVCNTYTAPNGTVYTTSGTYSVVIPNAAGCDSTITINLTVNNATSSTISPTVCTTYTAPDGTVYTTSGTYTAVIPNAAGCDSTITINLTVNNASSSTISPTVCTTYTAPNGTVYTTSGIYSVVIPNAAGCDSTITINLTVNNATSSTISPTVCTTYTAPDGTVYTTSGIYTVVIPNAAGCDSTITINLTVNNATSSTISPTVCTTYTAPNGIVYTTSGTYTAVIPNAAGCDSTITINLTVNNATSSTISPTVCNTYTAPNGTVYTTSGTYTVVIPNAAGCDSTITINLTVKNSTTSTISPTVCNTYTAPNGTVYTTSGTYTAVIPNAAGCDSTITINLTVNNATSSTISPTVCNTYTAPNGTVYTTSGTYTAVIPNAAGCDSTITINLTVNNATSSSISPTVCNTYTAPDGAVYTASGTYSAVIPNAAGCDSTITINLTVNNATSSTISSTVCNTYTAPNGTVYTSSGTYTAIIPNAAGCDSTITINLTVNNSSTVNAGSDQIVCEGTEITLTASGAATYSWSNGVNNGTPFIPVQGVTTYTVTGTDADGCIGTDQVSVNAAALPTLELNASTPTCAGETDANIYSQITSGSGTLGYVWNTGATTPDLLSVGSGTYVLTVTNAVGCVVGDTVTVSENPEPCFSIPGGLSPNGDNVNDTWTLNGLDNYPLAVIKVFNRWGQVIWSGDIESAGWDGTYEGKEMPTADYYYAIDLGNGEQYNGVVTLKR